jgi:hypothetical protein
MRTTIRLDAALLAEAKKLAAETDQTLTAIIEDALRERLARRKSRPAPPVRLVTFRGARTRRTMRPTADGWKA